MYVDNEPDMTDMLKMALEYAGFTVDTFNDPVLALQIFEPNLYDLLILDVMMPKMDGVEVYEHLKKIDPNLKVCFLTAGEMYHQEVREVEHCAFK